MCDDVLPHILNCIVNGTLVKIKVPHWVLEIWSCYLVLWRLKKGFDDTSDQHMFWGGFFRT